MAEKQSTLQKIKEAAKLNAKKQATDIHEKYTTRALEFEQAIVKSLENIDEGVREVRSQNATIQRVIEEDRMRRKNLEDTKAQTLKEKTQEFQQSARQVTMEVEMWISDVLTNAELHHTKLTETEQKYRTKLEELKKNAPEEHLRKAEEHKQTFQVRKDAEEHALRTMDERIGEIRQRVEADRRAMQAQTDNWCAERSRQIEKAKADVDSKLNMCNAEILAELHRAAIEFGIVDR